MVIWTAALLAIYAPTAHAGSISSASNRYVFDAAAGETNNLTVSQEISNCGAVPYPCTAIEDVVPINSLPIECEHELGVANWAVCPLVDNVTVNAGDGNDTVVIYDPFTAIVNGGDGNDTIGGASGNDQLDGGPGNDDISGWNGNDTISGGPGDDLLESQYSRGDPVSTGTDTLSGGDGSDKLIYYQRVDSMNVSLDGIANDGAPGENDNVGTDIESVQTGAGDDVLTGNGDPNALDGYWGNDTIHGGGGNDTLTGGDGNDTVDGGAGADTLWGDTTCGTCPGGTDEIFARDGAVDSIGCGPAGDTAHVDYNDIVAADPGQICESLDRGAPPRPPTRCVVPAVRGKKLAAARTAIIRAHCTVGKVTKKHSSAVKSGRVISQKPAPRKRLPVRSRVSLVVSLGRKH